MIDFNATNLNLVTRTLLVQARQSAWACRRYDDASNARFTFVMHSCLLDGILRRIRSDHRLTPLHRIENQSHQWGLRFLRIICGLGVGSEPHPDGHSVIKVGKTIDPFLAI